jgi:hypothetical protein
MVPFSFKSEVSYLRVMKRYLTDMYWMMGSMDFWINGSSVTLDSIGGTARADSRPTKGAA